MPLDPEKVKAAMATKGLSNADLSKLTGIAPPNITRILSGERNDPQLSTLERIAKALRCKVAKLLK